MTAGPRAMTFCQRRPRPGTRKRRGRGTALDRRRPLPASNQLKFKVVPRDRGFSTKFKFQLEDLACHWQWVLVVVMVGPEVCGWWAPWPLPGLRLDSERQVLPSLSRWVDSDPRRVPTPNPVTVTLRLQAWGSLGCAGLWLRGPQGDGLTRNDECLLIGYYLNITKIKVHKTCTYYSISIKGTQL
jgi:hypothetical protein